MPNQETGTSSAIGVATGGARVLLRKRWACCCIVLVVKAPVASFRADDLYSNRMDGVVEETMRVRMPQRALVTIPLLALGALLLWQIVTRSLAAYLASTSPASALLLRPTEATALVTLAEEELYSLATSDQPTDRSSVPAEVARKDDRLKTDGDKLAGWSELALKAIADKPQQAQEGGPAALPLGHGERAQIRARAEDVLIADPLNPRALRILGQLAAADGDEAAATKYMRAATARSLGETVALTGCCRRALGTRTTQRRSTTRMPLSGNVRNSSSTSRRCLPPWRKVVTNKRT